MAKTTTKPKTTVKKKSATKRRAIPKVTDAEAAALPALKRRRIRFHRSHFNFLLIIGSLIVLGTMGYNYVAAQNQAVAEEQTAAVGVSNQADETHLFYAKRLEPLIKKAKQFEASQSDAGLEIADPATINSQIGQIETYLRKSKLHQASSSTNTFSTNLTMWQKSLDGQLSNTKIASVSTSSNNQYQVPILLYHKPPTDFEHQLQILRQRNYTTITFAQLAAAFNGASLPAKPVIITFDDGFA